MSHWDSSESEFAQSCPTLCDPWTVAHQAPPSMGFSGQEYWSGLPFPSPGDLPDPGVEPRSPTLQANALTSAPPGKPVFLKMSVEKKKKYTALLYSAVSWSSWENVANVSFVISILALCHCDYHSPWPRECLMYSVISDCLWTHGL